jgi:hypothetical protein
LRIAAIELVIGIRRDARIRAGRAPAASRKEAAAREDRGSEKEYDKQLPFHAWDLVTPVNISYRRAISKQMRDRFAQAPVRITGQSNAVGATGLLVEKLCGVVYNCS